MSGTVEQPTAWSIQRPLVGFLWLLSILTVVTLWMQLFTG